MHFAGNPKFDASYSMHSSKISWKIMTWFKMWSFETVYAKMLNLRIYLQFLCLEHNSISTNGVNPAHNIEF